MPFPLASLRAMSRLGHLAPLGVLGVLDLEMSRPSRNTASTLHRHRDLLRLDLLLTLGYHGLPGTGKKWQEPVILGIPSENFAGSTSAPQPSEPERLPRNSPCGRRSPASLTHVGEDSLLPLLWNHARLELLKISDSGCQHLGLWPQGEGLRAQVIQCKAHQGLVHDLSAS